jgi:hypothetical protein
MESFIIAKYYVPLVELKEIAKIILEAQEIYNSYYKQNNLYASKTYSQAVIEAFKDSSLPSLWINIIINWLVFINLTIPKTEY